MSSWRVLQGLFLAGVTAACFAITVTQAQAGDWARFRGPNGTGISADSDPLPTTFSETENLKWKVALPGAGVSCPIVVGDRVFVTCYSGYGLDRQNPGELKDLKRHLVCIDRANGETLWEKTVEAVMPEDEFFGAGVPEHGYASHTPVSDGKNVYVFFGKSGVFAYDLDGKELWNASVGTGSDNMAWGSSSSPIVHEDLLVVAAGAEARAVVGLDKNTGKELWRSESDSLGSVWGTPAVSKVDDSRTDIVIGAPYEIWGINPATGKLKWFCNALESNQFNSSVLVTDSTIFASEGGRGGGGSIAVKTGGKGDITASNVVWTVSDSSTFSTPLLFEDRLYLVSGGMAKCISAADGKEIFQARLQAGAAGGAPGSGAPGGRGPGAGGFGGGGGQPPVGGGPGGFGGGGQPPGGGGRGGRGGFGGFGGGGMGGDYSSPVLGDGKIYYVTRGGDIHVIKAGDTFEKLATNRLTSESEDFSATPAISDGQIFFRSSKHLYCVSEQ